jgi:cytoskeletal protein RodZ
MRTVLLGTLGLVLAVAVGVSVHLLTRGTISLPVVQLEPAPALAPPAARTIRRTTTVRTETERETETESRTTTPPATSPAPATTEDNSGRGRGRGRSGGSDDDSGKGSADD